MSQIPGSNSGDLALLKKIEALETVQNNITGYRKISNTDSYFKFPDGTLIYFKYLTEHTMGSNSGYPGGHCVMFGQSSFQEVVFKEVLSVLGAPVGAYAMALCETKLYHDSEGNVTGVSAVFARGTSADQGYAAYITVFGRWK